MKVTAFVPCRSGSQRVENKNTRPFSKYKDGLIELKLKQLINSSLIDQICVSTNDDKVKSVAKRFSSEKVIVDDRNSSLCGNQTSTDELIRYVPSIIQSGVVIWTHTTSPFITEKIYDKALEIFFEKTSSGLYDSLMSVTDVREFLWDDNHPLNYDRNQEKWPRTQTLERIYSVNSAVFISTVELYKKYQDRIGKNPFMLSVDKLESWDIDWPDDFVVAEKILESGVLDGKLSGV